MPRVDRPRHHFTETYTPSVPAQHLAPKRPNVICPWESPLPPNELHRATFIVPQEEFGRILESLPFCEVIIGKHVVKAGGCLKKDLVKYTINLPYRLLNHQINIFHSHVSQNPLGFGTHYYHIKSPAGPKRR